MKEKFLLSLKLAEHRRKKILKVLFQVTLTFVLVALAGCSKSCGCKCGEVNVNSQQTSGSAVLEINGLNALAPATGSSFVSVSFTGNLVSDAGGSGNTSFSINITCEVSHAGISPDPRYSRVNLKPGTWEMKATAANWNATCQGNISEGLGKTFTYNYGKSGCSVH